MIPTLSLLEGAHKGALGSHGDENHSS